MPEPMDFESAILQESNLGQVILTQIHIEHLIDDYIGVALDCPEELDPILKELGYFGKVHLALALGLASNLKLPLLSIGSIRNSFAHKLNAAIDSNYINTFYKSFPSEERKNIIDICKTTNQSWIVNGLQWRDVCVKEKFRILCMHLYYSCKFEIQKKTHEHDMDKLGRIALR